MKPGNPKEVESLFDGIASSYDFLNDLFSFGLHRVWKRQLLVLLRPLAGEKWLDLCCGTGDLSFSLARQVRPGGSVLGLDSAKQPLKLAKKRSLQNSWLALSWRNGDALDTKLPSNYFDGAVMAFGLRNLSDPLEGLIELNRLLKPGARAGVLDFNRFREKSLNAWFQKVYLRNLVVPIASTFNLKEHYEYLEESLKLFPSGFDQEKLGIQAGFISASHRKLAGGQMGVLLLRKKIS